jgi:hypothetical protein
MSDRRGKVLSFGPFELSIGNRLLTDGAKVVPLGARARQRLRCRSCTPKGIVSGFARLSFIAW